MVKTRAQIEAMTKEELKEELLECFDITNQIILISDKLDDMSSNYNKVLSKLAVSKKWNTLLWERVHQLERETLNSSQFLRHEMIEVSNIPHTIGDNELETKICQVLSMTNVKVLPSML